MSDFKGSHFEKEIILWGVRWYVAYSISYRQLEEMLGERGVAVDHATLNRWVIKYAPEFEKQCPRQQRPVGQSWRLDETSVKIKGEWAYLYRAVDKDGHTIDFLLKPNRDRDAAEMFLRKAIRTQGCRRKSRSIRVAATRQQLSATTRLTKRQLSSGIPNISIISWSRTLER
jgi:putative transposase